MVPADICVNTSKIGYSPLMPVEVTTLTGVQQVKSLPKSPLHSTLVSAFTLGTAIARADININAIEKKLITESLTEPNQNPLLGLFESDKRLWKVSGFFTEKHRVRRS